MHFTIEICVIDMEYDKVGNKTGQDFNMKIQKMLVVCEGRGCSRTKQEVETEHEPRKMSKKTKEEKKERTKAITKKKGKQHLF